MLILFPYRLKTQNYMRFMYFFPVWIEVSPMFARKWAKQLIPLEYVDILKNKKVLFDQKKNHKLLEIITGDFFPTDFI